MAVLWRLHSLCEATRRRKHPTRNERADPRRRFFEPTRLSIFFWGLSLFLYLPSSKGGCTVWGMAAVEKTSFLFLFAALKAESMFFLQNGFLWPGTNWVLLDVVDFYRRSWLFCLGEKVNMEWTAACRCYCPRGTFRFTRRQRQLFVPFLLRPLLFGRVQKMRKKWEVEGGL